MEKRRHLAIIIVVAAVAASLSFWFIGRPFVSNRLAATSPFDGGKNYRMARIFVEQGVLSDYQNPPFIPTARILPLYSFFLAALISVGASPLASVGIQFALSVLIPIFSYGIARFFLSPRGALAIGLIMALHPLQSAMPSTFDDAWLFEIFWLAGLFWYFRGIKNDPPRWTDLIISGLLLGLSGLTRPLTMVLWPLLVLGFFIRHRRRALIGAVLLVVVLFTVWIPWFYRNWQQFHRVFITTQDSYILTWDAYAFYVADIMRISHPEAKHRVRLELETLTGRSLPYEGGDAADDPFLNDPALAARAKQYVFGRIARDPFRYMVSHARHSLPFWTGSALREFLATAQLYPAHLQGGLPVFTREITAGNWPVVGQGIRLMGPGWSALYLFDFLFLTLAPYLLALVGMWRLWRSGDPACRTFGVIMFFLLAFSSFVTSGVYIGPRYRFPFEPLLWMLVVIGLGTPLSPAVVRRRE